MVKLLSGYIRKQVAKQLGKHVLDATLTKLTPGTRTPGAVSGGTHPTSTDYAAKGFVSDYADNTVDGTTILDTDRAITLLGGTLPAGIAPVSGDRITIADFAGGPTRTYVIAPGQRAVQSDPDGATFTCQGR